MPFNDLLDLKDKNKEVISFALDNVKESIFLINKEGIFKYINAEACRKLEYTNNELLYMTVMDINNEFDSERWKSYWHELKEKKSLMFESQHTTKNGIIIPVEINSNFIVHKNIEYVLAFVRDITERKRIEEALRESEWRYREIFENVIDGLYLLEVTEDGHFRNLELNTGFEKSTGLSREQLIGKLIEETVSPEVADVANAKYKRCVEMGHPIVENAVLDLPIGRRYYQSTLIPARDENGKIYRIIGISRDVTENKLAEEEILKLNRLYKTLAACNETLVHAKDESELLNNICEIIVEKGGYKMVWVGFAEQDKDLNVKPIAFSGFENGYLRQINISWGDNQYGRGPTGTAIRTGKYKVMNSFSDPNYSTWKQKAESHGYKSSAAFPLLIDNKVLGTLNIYSESQNAFDESECNLLQELANDLAYGIASIQSEEKYRTLLEKIQAAVVVHSSDTSILTSNSLAEDYLRLTKDQMKGKTSQDPVWHFSDENGRILPIEEYPANLVISSGKKLRNYVLKVHRSNNDGDSWFLVNADPVINKIGDLYQVIVTFIDITERKNMEAEIKQLNQSLENRVRERTAQLVLLNKELESFSYSVSHDLRTPLFQIDGYVELLKEKLKGNLDGDIINYINNISKSTKQMNKLIGDILSFSDLRHHKIQYNSININKLVNELIRFFEKELENRTVNWNIASFPFVMCDESLMRQVLFNFLSNALKFTKKREIAIIEMTYIDSETEHIFSIKDNGAGFDMKYKNKLFQEFKRLHSKEEFEGTGIGLANVRRIIERHGGRTWAKGEVDKGAIFYFSLPKNPTKSE